MELSPLLQSKLLKWLTERKPSIQLNMYPLSVSSIGFSFHKFVGFVYLIWYRYLMRIRSILALILWWSFTWQLWKWSLTLIILNQLNWFVPFHSVCQQTGTIQIRSITFNDDKVIVHQSDTMRNIFLASGFNVRTQTRNDRWYKNEQTFDALSNVWLKTPPPSNSFHFINNNRKTFENDN